MATEGFCLSSVRVDHEEPTKKSYKNLDLGKPASRKIQNGRRVSKMIILQIKNYNFFKEDFGL